MESAGHDRGKGVEYIPLKGEAYHSSREKGKQWRPTLKPFRVQYVPLIGEADHAAPKIEDGPSEKGNPLPKLSKLTSLPQMIRKKMPSFQSLDFEDPEADNPPKYTNQMLYDSEVNFGKVHGDVFQIIPIEPPMETEVVPEDPQEECVDPSSALIDSTKSPPFLHSESHLSKGRMVLLDYTATGRTQQAWLRTCLSLMTTGLFLGKLLDIDSSGIGVLLICLGFVLFVISYAHFRRKYYIFHEKKAILVNTRMIALASLTTLTSYVILITLMKH